MRHGTRQLFGERARHGAWRPATGLVLRRRVAGFYAAVDNHVNYRGQRNSEGIEISDSTQRGFYDEAGEFRWISIRLEDAPLWVRDRVGYHGGEQAGTRRGIAMRTMDYSGQSSEVMWETY